MSSFRCLANKAVRYLRNEMEGKYLITAFASMFFLSIWKMGIEALPYSYLAGWIGMLVAETPLLLKTYKTWGKKGETPC